MNRIKIESIIDKFPQNRIMVVGDIMLDEYLEGTVERISPEAPIPVVNLLNNKVRDVRLGGSANVFNNLVSLGGKDILLCGVIGDDDNGRMIKGMLRGIGAEVGGLIVDADRPTSIKTRIIAHNQQVIRLDREERKPISEKTRSYIIKFIIDRLDSLDAIIFSDYEKGTITKELLEVVLPLAEKKNIIIAVDPKFTNFKYFKKVTIIVPNRKEASGFVRHEINNDYDALVAAQYILKKLECECVLVKLGERGMRIVDRNGCDVMIKTVAEQVYDVTGAGDTVISTLVLSKSSGATWEEAARIANYAAGIVIHYIGTSAVNAKQLKSAILENRFPEP
jgi:D-beta-D-heptose 7-phosphate kinase/D-beta-D-heptose 1-phosphate adenosyltransferase